MPNTAVADVSHTTLAINTDDLDQLLDKEWLLTNSRGSYCSGTVVGCNTRRYHGLLVSSGRPPVERIVTIGNLLEEISLQDQTYSLANLRFSDCYHPRGFEYLKSFHADGVAVRFRYELDGFQPLGETLSIEKSIFLAYDKDTVIVTYEFTGSEQQVHFSLSPMMALRDFHALQTCAADLQLRSQNNQIAVYNSDSPDRVVSLICHEATFNQNPQWWYDIHYPQEFRRGQSFREDSWVPGAFEISFNGPKRITFIAEAHSADTPPDLATVDPDECVTRLTDRQCELIELGDARDPIDKMLVQAADQFVVRRQRPDTANDTTTILAGYHWFADWGRDALIALPGLLLCTGRFNDAREVLHTFAHEADEGLIPNCFNDYGGRPLYNSVDASLWFVNAAYQYLQVTQDQATFQNEFLPAIESIITSYANGIHDHIYADDDGLISAGNDQSQLTWMDARCEGVSFTPRFGKTVEVNALWINALQILAQTSEDPLQKQKVLEVAKKAQSSFRRVFWNDQIKGLNDCIAPDGSVDATIRPNQIFAVSLPFGCLFQNQQKAVVSLVADELLTPLGLRSLSPRDSRYQGQYSGDPFQRDSAYHQGTVWAWLIGPFVEAHLKVHHFSQKAKQQAHAFLEPLLIHLDKDACLGSVSEIFDGDQPWPPKGCIAQAWSVAELLRCRKLLR